MISKYGPQDMFYNEKSATNQLISKPCLPQALLSFVSVASTVQLVAEVVSTEILPEHLWVAAKNKKLQT
jgi:hypothetical protein